MQIAARGTACKRGGCYDLSYSTPYAPPAAGAAGLVALTASDSAADVSSSRAFLEAVMRPALEEGAAGRRRLVALGEGAAKARRLT